MSHRDVAAVVAATLLLAACAHTREDSFAGAPRTAVPEAAAATESETSSTESAAPAEPASESRPRLSRTVTLGETQYVPPTPPQQGAGGQSQNVVVNNTVIVQGAAGYAPYGGYRGYGYGRSTGAADYGGRSGGQRGTPQWGSSGWEGARRTAAPGQTPAVGGNWSPPPSYGPSQMK